MTNMSLAPGYRKLYDSGELEERIEKLYGILKECTLCPRECGAKRLDGEVGVCGAGAKLKVSSVFPHFGEEPPLVGQRGSGTVFLAHCNLRCVFCQNYEISHLGQGGIITPEKLASQMIGLQNLGCHNINFVTPTQYAPQIVEAIKEAAKMGLMIPIVWNCGGYESSEVIKLLDGVVDIYMPDIKYSKERSAKKYSAAPDYFKVVKDVVTEMSRQAGSLEIDDRGIARRGLLVRHLVMPDGVCGSGEIFRFIAEDISKETYINIMDQYRPVHEACRREDINRPITSDEFNDAIKSAESFGLHRGFCY